MTDGSVPETRWISRRHPGVSETLLLQLAILASLPQPVPGVCMDCDGVAMVRALGDGFQVLSFHRDTCPSPDARAARAHRLDAEQDGLGA